MEILPFLEFLLTLTPSPPLPFRSTPSLLCAFCVAAGGAPLSLSDLSNLLFDKQDARSLYCMYRMLADDTVYFKQVGGTRRMREPRPKE